MKNYFHITFLALVLAVSGGCSSGLEKEFNKLKKEISTNSDSASAEELNKKAEAFVERIGRFKNPPKGLIEKARNFQQECAAKVVAKNKAAGIEPKKVEEIPPTFDVTSDDPKNWQ